MTGSAIVLRKMLSGRAHPYKQRACSMVAVSASCPSSWNKLSSIVMASGVGCCAAAVQPLIAASSHSHLQLIYKTPKSHAPGVPGIAAHIVPSGTTRVLTTRRQVVPQDQRAACHVRGVAAMTPEGPALPAPVAWHDLHAADGARPRHGRVRDVVARFFVGNRPHEAGGHGVVRGGVGERG